MKLHNFRYSKNHCHGPVGLGTVSYDRNICSIGRSSNYLVPESFQDLGSMQSQDDDLFFLQGGRMETGDSSVTHMKLTGDVYPRLKSADEEPEYNSGMVPCEPGKRVTWSHLGAEYFHSYVEDVCYSFIDGKCYSPINVPQFVGILTQSYSGLPTIFSFSARYAMSLRLPDINRSYRTCILVASCFTSLVCDQPQSISADVTLFEPAPNYTGQIQIKFSNMIGPFLFDSWSSAESIVSAVEQQLMSLCRQNVDWARTEASRVTKYSSSFDIVASYTVPSLSRLVHSAKYDMLQLFSSGPSSADWGDIAQTAVQDCRWTDINSIAYLADLREMFGTAKALAGLFADYENPKKWLNAYLSLKYGDRLTYADSKELLSAIADATASLLAWKKDFHAVRAAQSYSITNEYGSYVAECHYKIYYRNPGYPLLDSIKTMMDWDLYPNLSNLWDLVPFSFVVDWFVSVGDFLEAFDDNIYVQYLDIIHCTKSCKMTCKASQLPSLRSYAVSGVEGTYYVRSTPITPDLPVPSLHANDAWKDNLLTLGAIILQKC